jgi:hypothetical protein
MSLTQTEIKGNVTLASDGGSVILNNPSINNPTSINYATTTSVQPARGTALNQQFSTSNIIESGFTAKSSGSAQAVVNGIPYGRYLIATYFFVPSDSGTFNCALRFASSTSTITNGQTSKTELTIYGRGIGEAFGYKSQTGIGREFSLNSTFIFDFNTTTGQNLAVWCQTSTDNIINAYCTLQLVRLS